MDNQETINNAVRDMTKVKSSFFVIGVLESTLSQFLTPEQKTEVAAHLAKVAESVAKESGTGKEEAERKLKWLGV